MTQLLDIVKIVAFVLIALSITTVVLEFVDYFTEKDWRDRATPKIDTACYTGNDCLKGASIQIGDTHYCTTPLPKRLGSACDSTCHVDGTATTCQDANVCGSDDPTTCLGYCAIDPADSDGSIYQFAHPDCADKFPFKDFYKWDTALSSALPDNWIYYSDYEPDCSVYGGCRGYGMQMQLVMQGGTNTDVFAHTSTMVDCIEFLNLTNSECIQAQTIPLQSDIATPFFVNIFQPPYSPTNISDWRLQGNMCIYSYKCGTDNTTALTDPTYLQGKKRTLGSAATGEPDPLFRLMELMHEHKDRIAPRIAALVQRQTERLKRIADLVR